MSNKFFKCEGCHYPKSITLRVPASPRFCWSCFLDGLKKVVAPRRIKKETQNYTQFRDGDIISVNGVGPYTVTGVNGYQVQFNSNLGPGWADARMMNLKKHEIKQQPILL